MDLPALLEHNYAHVAQTHEEISVNMPIIQISWVKRCDHFFQFVCSEIDNERIPPRCRLLFNSFLAT